MEKTLQQIAQRLYGVEIETKLTRPDPQFGDYATNIALQLAKPLGKNPREVAEEISTALRETGEFSEVTVAGPGFINVRISAKALAQKLQNEGVILLVKTWTVLVKRSLLNTQAQIWPSRIVLATYARAIKVGRFASL